MANVTPPPPENMVSSKQATKLVASPELRAMHELAITENILEIALRHAAQSGAARITDMHLVVGELTSIVDESVQFYWDIVAEGTAAAGAKLHFRRVPAQLSCRSCGHTYSPRENLPCPACGSVDIAVVAGDEFYLEAIDIVPVSDLVIEEPL
jgi:hydrogenase nickel incorporation protein HypA/HybF